MIWRLMLGHVPQELRETIAGDLLEESASIFKRHGRVVAQLWLAANAFGVAMRFELDRFSRGRQLPPIGNEIRKEARMIDSLKQDLAFGLRMLRRQPGFTMVAVMALALGIGANTAIFSVADTVLWRPLPYSQPDRIMQVAEQRPKEGRSFGPVSPADYFDWRRDNASFEAMAAYNGEVANLTGGSNPERVRLLDVSPDFLSVLGIPPAWGRDFHAAEEQPGNDQVAILTDAFWRRSYGADPSILGRSIQLNGIGYQVIGILPAFFRWQSKLEMLVPLALTDHDRALRGAHFLDVIARLRSGVTMEQAASEMDAIGARLAQSFPEDNTGHGPRIRLLRERLVGNVRPGLMMLLAAVGLVLLIACSNVATLLLARASVRQRELAVRRAVGASRLRLVRQMLTESLLLSLISGIAALAVAWWCIALFKTFIPPELSSLPGLADIGIDRRVLFSCAVITLGSGIVFGLIPAWSASRQTVAAALGEETRGGSGSARTVRLRSLLVIGEIALSLTLLVGAGLLIASFRNLLSVSPGFRADHLVTAEIGLPGSRYPNHARAIAFFDTLYAALSAHPETDGVAATAALPFSGQDSRLDLNFENRSFESSSPVRAHPRLVSADYLRVMGIPILRGRPFSDRDDASSPPVVIINDTAARQYWPGENPIGQRISLGSPARWMEIVGVAGDIHHDGLETDPVPEAYIPHRQGFSALGSGLDRYMTVLVRTSASLAVTTAWIRESVRAIDSQQPVADIQTMDNVIGESVAARRLNLALMAAFAALALLLTAAGLYGVMSYLVVQRVREIGLRVALGANRRQILQMVFRQAGALTAAGIVLGILSSLWLTRWMSAMLFGVSTTSPSIYVAVALLLSFVALLAVAVPSHRAIRIDPLAALRDS